MAGKPQVSPSAVSHPDTPHPSSCKQRAEEGKVKQPHPLMSPHGWAQVRAHPGPLSALGLPPTLGAHQEAAVGKPRETLGPLGTGWHTQGPPSPCPGPEPSARCHSSIPCCSVTLEPRLLLPGRLGGGRAGGQLRGGWLPLPRACPSLPLCVCGGACIYVSYVCMDR